MGEDKILALGLSPNLGVGDEDTYLSIVLIATIVDNIRTYSKKY